MKKVIKIVYLTYKQKYGIECIEFMDFILAMQYVGAAQKIEDWLVIIKNCFRGFKFEIININNKLQQFIKSISEENLYITLVYYCEQRLQALEVEAELKYHSSDQEDASMEDINSFDEPMFLKELVKQLNVIGFTNE